MLYNCLRLLRTGNACVHRMGELLYAALPFCLRAGYGTPPFAVYAHAVPYAWTTLP